MKFKLTLKYSSFFFTSKVSLVKNITQEVDVTGLPEKDKAIINAYIRSGAIISDSGELPVEVEVTEVVEQPVVEEKKVEEVVVEATVEEVLDIKDILAEPEVTVEEAPVKKKPAAKKTTKK
jgi:hypothetical protein